MPKNYKKKKFVFGKNNSLKKKVARLAKVVKPLTASMVEDSQLQLQTISNTYRGLNPSSSTLDNVGYGICLSSLAEGTGVQRRIEDRVKFKNITLRLLMIDNKNASYANYNETLMRVVILHIKQMPGQPGGRYHPFINEFLHSTNPMGYSDIMSFPALQNNRDNTKNITVLADKLLHVSPTAPEAHPNKIYTNDSKTEYLGVYNQVLLNFNIRALNSITTYDNDSNALGSCNQNHYVLYVFNPCNVDAQKIQIAHQTRVYYENLL